MPQKILLALDRVNADYLQEIRLRLDKPAALLYAGKKCFLSGNGCCAEKEKALVILKADIEHTLLNACEHSLHAYSEQMIRGYIMLAGGIRLGVCGTAVTSAEKIISFKDVSSLNIRIPREVKNCSAAVAGELLNPLKNILIVSRPGAGKTTFLRDLIYQTSKLQNPPNILVADERNEIAGSSGGSMQFDLGIASDVISLSSKFYAFESGLRTMTPDIIACDEIVSADIAVLKHSKNCGVKMFATVHAEDLAELSDKSEFRDLTDIFDRFVVLSNRNKIGEITGIFDKELKQVAYADCT